MSDNRIYRDRIASPPLSGGSRGNGSGQTSDSRFIPNRSPTMHHSFDLLSPSPPSQNAQTQSNSLLSSRGTSLSPETIRRPVGVIDAGDNADIRRPSAGNSGGSATSSANTPHVPNKALSSSIYQSLLRSEMFDSPTSPQQYSDRDSASSKSKSPSALLSNNAAMAPSVFSYGKHIESSFHTSYKSSPSSPIGPVSQRMLAHTTRTVRDIPKQPYRTLEAPAIQDDFYLHLVDWSALNVLAVALTNFVYLWNGLTAQVTKLCDVGHEDCVTAVKFMQRGTHLAVACNSGKVYIYDVGRLKKVRTYANHRQRVGTLAWNAHILTSGARDRLIINRDVRAAHSFTSKLKGHKQEVCGLEWSPDGSHLASGGNDNLVLVWDALQSARPATAANASYNASSPAPPLSPTMMRNGASSLRVAANSPTPDSVVVDAPLHRFLDHSAAVKALAWSPHQRGLLASGGGTADRSIRFWNALTGEHLQKRDTDSQVCNLAWSANVNEILSTHGYSQNEITIWSYPDLTQTAVLTGHTMRVLYLAVSPDGTSIVTGAGDETLRFWNIWPAARRVSGDSPLEARFEIR